MSKVIITIEDRDDGGPENIEVTVDFDTGAPDKDSIAHILAVKMLTDARKKYTETEALH